MNGSPQAQATPAQEITELTLRALRAEEPSAGELQALMGFARSGSQPMAEVVAAMCQAAPAGPGRIYLAIGHSLLMEETGQIAAALNSWNIASRSHSGRIDLAALQAVGIDGEEGFRRRASRMQTLRSAYLRQAASRPRAEHGPAAVFRIDRALAGYLGEAAVFSSHPTQRPKVMFVPGLGTSGFLEPASHPLVPFLREAYPRIRDDFERALAEGSRLEPFLGVSASTSPHGYVSGGAHASWDAVFFFRHGQRFDDVHSAFPDTSRALDTMDLCRIGGQSPEVCFSVLQPGTRIERHHGVTNARVVIHLPLRIPSGAHLELTAVGLHYWKEGEPMVFDDTFEHGALNPARTPRGILLMDAWHPALSLVEREAFRLTIEAITRIEQDHLMSGDPS